MCGKKGAVGEMHDFPQYRRGSVPDWNIRKVMEHVIGIVGRSQKLLCSVFISTHQNCSQEFHGIWGICYFRNHEVLEERMSL